MRGASSRCAALALAACLTIVACGDAEGRGGEAVPDAARAGRLPPPVIEPLPTPYMRAGQPATGSVRGIVRLTVPPPPDTIVRPPANQDVCGREFRDETVRVVQADRVAGAVVWISNAPSGKALPLSRRYELVAQRCRLTPRVLTAVVGGTVNVRSADPLLHRLRVLDARSGDTFTVLLHNDRGQVVPVQDPLAAPRLIEMRGDEHRWMRAWIAVFDHPYFTTTGRDGSFTLDSVPPGTYELRTWHERFGVRVDTVEVGDGETVLEVGLGG